MRRTYCRHLSGLYTDDLHLVAANLCMNITGIQYGDCVYRQIVDDVLIGDVLSPAWMNGDRIPASRIMDAVARAMEPVAYAIDLVGSAENRELVEKKVANAALAHDTIA